MSGQGWVDTWVSVPQPTGPDDLPPPPFTRDGLVLAGATLRQTVRASVGGQRLRLCLSNAFGGTGLPVTAASVALPLGGRAGVSAVQPGTLRPVSFHGRPSVVVAAGAQAESDPLLPVGGNATYDDPQGHRERARQAVNEWVRGSGRLDGVVDFDRAVRDPDHPHRLAPAFDDGDHLHLNPAGYRALADSVPVGLFRSG